MKKLIILFILITVALTGFSCSLGGEKDNPGGVFKSIDSGETWMQKGFVEQVKNKNITINNTDIRKLIFDPNDSSILYIGTNSDGVFKSTDSAEHWERTGLNSGQITSLEINQKDSQILYATSGRYLYKSENAGADWEIIYTDSNAEGKLYNMVIDNFDTDRVYVTNDTGGLFKSYDAGDTWQQINWFDGPVSILKLSPKDSRKIFAVLDGRRGIWISESGGDDWLELNSGLKNFGGSGKQINSFVFDRFNLSTIYLGTDYGLLKSTDEGNSWEAIKTLVGFNSQPIYLVVPDPQNPNTLYHTTSKIIYRSPDGGFSWTALPALPSNRQISQMVIHPTQNEIIYTGVLKIK